MDCIPYVGYISESGMWEVKPYSLVNNYRFVMISNWIDSEKTHSERACRGSSLLKRLCGDGYLLGKTHKYSRLGKYIGIVGDWTSKSGHNSHTMYYVCMLMCMYMLNWCMSYAWCGVQTNTSFMICVCDTWLCGNQCFRDTFESLTPWDFDMSMEQVMKLLISRNVQCAFFGKGRNSRAS